MVLILKLSVIVVAHESVEHVEGLCAGVHCVKILVYSLLIQQHNDTTENVRECVWRGMSHDHPGSTGISSHTCVVCGGTTLQHASPHGVTSCTGCGTAHQPILAK